MNLVRFNSFAPTKSILDEMFEDFFTDEMKSSKKIIPRFTRPLTNVIEEKDAFRIELAVPGVNKDEVEIKIQKDELVIRSEKEESKAEENDQYTRKEFYYGSFEKSFHLPESIDRNAIEASFNKGVLHIELKKKEEAIEKGPQHIEIK